MHDLEDIYKDNFQLVYKYLVILTNNPDIAEELTQETFYRAIKNINKFSGKSKLSSWLCKIAKNLWIDEVKKYTKFQTINENDLIETDEEKIFANEDKLKLFKNIQELDEETKDVIYLRLTGELNFKEIGKIMNKNETWARVTFYRGKEKLKEDDKNEK